MNKFQICVLISCLSSALGCGAPPNITLDAGTESDDPDSSTDAVTRGDGCTVRAFFLDADGDGHGDPEMLTTACEVPEGYVENDDDCNDACPTCFEGSTEVCDELDQDCDGMVDEDLPLIVSYADLDGDTFGDPDTEMFSCAIATGRVAQGDDCDDRSRLTNPDAAEVCNEIDDNCDGNIDEGVLIRVYRDADGDGFGSEASDQCAIAPGFTTQAGDCNDDRASIYPGAREECDRVDNDCDGDIDEGVETAYYADCDGDGYPLLGVTARRGCAPPSTPPSTCRSGGEWTTQVPQAGHSDCDDSNRAVSPAVTTFSSAPRTGSNFDYNCDGINQRQDERSSSGSCRRDRRSGIAHFCSDAGWVGEIPACGAIRAYHTCDSFSCAMNTVIRTQQCR